MVDVELRYKAERCLKHSWLIPMVPESFKVVHESWPIVLEGFIYDWVSYNGPIDARTEETCVKAWIQGDDVCIQMTMPYL